MAKTLVQQLGELVATTRFTELPDSALAAARRSLIDFIGCAQASSAEDFADKIVGLGLAMGKQPDCTVIGRTERMAAPSAALVNGTLAHGYDFDDTHLPSLAHLTGAVVPAVLAIGEARDISGADLLAGQIVGTEIGVRIGRAVRSAEWNGSSLRNQGFFATSAIGTAAAAGGVARALGFSPELAASAIALGCNVACGTVELAKGDSGAKRSQPGWTAQAGLAAALLAEAGFSGPSRAFEGDHGFFKAFAAGRWFPERMTENWGQSWGIEEISIKRYPVEHYIQPLVELAEQYRREVGDDTRAITRIEASLPDQIQRNLFVPRELKAAPPNPHAALMSAPYSMALALTKQPSAPLGVEDFGAGFRRDAETARLASIVEFAREEKFDAAFPAAAPGRLRMFAGAKLMFEAELDCEYGNPKRPMAMADVVAKFDANCRQRSPEWRQAVVDAIDRLDRISTRQLGQKLSPNQSTKST